jgi:mono/diheme cytochrome c family protein
MDARMSAPGNWFGGLSPARRGILIGGAAVVVVGIAVYVWLVGGPGPTDFAAGPRVALADYHGPDPTGVPASLKDASLVKRGQYLAQAADCAECHTAKGGTEFAGGLAINLPFGTIYSPNITPDRETGIGEYSDADFLAAVHRGIRKDGVRLYPAMLYPTYAYMTDADVLAVKAYLFSLAPVHARAPENTLAFPFNQRWLMAIWSTFFNADKRYEPNAQQSAEWNRGAYLSEALAHCSDCHTPRNLAFAIDNRRKFAGAETAGWRAYNITSDKAAGVGAWSDDDLFAYLSAGHAGGHGTATGPMGEAIDAGLSHLDPADVRAIVAYLRTIPPKSSNLPATLAPPASPSHRIGPQLADLRGKHLFEGACVSCHSWTGQSAIIPFATFTGARAVNDPSATNVAQIVLIGARRETPNGPAVMPAFGPSFSDAEVAEVSNYVTARFGSAPSHITDADVQALRKATAP